MISSKSPCETMKATAIRPAMTTPCQKPEKLPDTIPDKIFKEAPASRLALTTSSTCFDFEDVKIFVNSGIIAAANVPQLMIVANFHQMTRPNCVGGNM